MWQLAASLWHQLSEAEQAQWERQGTLRHMTGFAWYMSQALRPNPGIYLPLAGGTMTGDIDMDGHQVTAMLDPIADQDAATKKYHDDNLPVGGYTEGCRVKRTSTQTIPNNTITPIIFDTENYDTDNMWEGVSSPSRITIRTAGIYLITGQVHWLTNAAGMRAELLRHNIDGYIVQVRTGMDPSTWIWRGPITTIYQCAVGNTLELQVYQNSLGNLDVGYDNNQSPVLAAQRIG